MATAATTSPLSALAQDCHILTHYDDVAGKRQVPSDESLLAILRGLGVEIDAPDQARDILERRGHDRRVRGIEPVHVAWNGRIPPIAVVVPRVNADEPIEFELETAAEAIAGRLPLETTGPLGRRDEQWRDQYVSRAVHVPHRLAMGYYRLRLQSGQRRLETLIISSPRQAFGHVAGGGRRRLFQGARQRAWGSFLPLYALRHQGDWGVGDFSALGELARWTGSQGGSLVGTLPLLAAFLDENFEPSPYGPASRMFWNEVYLDVVELPEWSAWHARTQGAGDDRERRLAALRAAGEVDYRETMRLKRGALEPMSRQFFEQRTRQFDQFEQFVQSQPQVEDYARFRAACERRRTPWEQWEPRARGGVLEEGDVDRAAVNYHLYVQWAAAQQLQAAEDTANRSGCGLYMDLPIGVHRSGYDAWRYQPSFTACTVGAPPDTMYTRGQSWGLPAMHPERLREDGYALLRQVMAANMRYASALRIDHVPGLHRLFCIPPGGEGADGAYVRYHADETYAVAIVESHRAECALIGENLGTVPPEVDRKMKVHGVAGMWVAPYELEGGRGGTLRPPPRRSVASLNTHDMFPLAAWWNGEDIDDRRQSGLLDDADVVKERQQRAGALEQLKEWMRRSGDSPPADQSGPQQEIPVARLLRALARSSAELVLVNLEDLWLERKPQNVPGTSVERPNWRRKARYSFEEFSGMIDVLEALADVDSSQHSQESDP